MTSEWVLCKDKWKGEQAWYASIRHGVGISREQAKCRPFTSPSITGHQDSGHLSKWSGPSREGNGQKRIRPIFKWSLNGRASISHRSIDLVAFKAVLCSHYSHCRCVSRPSACTRQTSECLHFVIRWTKCTNGTRVISHAGKWWKLSQCKLRQANGRFMARRSIIGKWAIGTSTKKWIFCPSV